MATDPKNTAPPEEPPTAAHAGIPSQDPRLKAQEPLTPSAGESEADAAVMGGGIHPGRRQHRQRQQGGGQRDNAASQIHTANPFKKLLFKQALILEARS